MRPYHPRSPLPIRTAKLSRVECQQYQRGGPVGKVTCCMFLLFCCMCFALLLHVFCSFRWLRSFSGHTSSNGNRDRIYFCTLTLTFMGHGIIMACKPDNKCPARRCAWPRVLSARHLSLCIHIRIVFLFGIPTVGSYSYSYSYSG